MHRVDLSEASSQLPDLFDEAVGGEEVLIVKGSEQAVRLVPAVSSDRSPKFGSAEGLVVVADDFDAPLQDFNQYTA